ncbi:GT4 family glycosyltransferase PelF [Luteococcus sp. Sow4_B9]|uniref:GT4 family glycosyltransferase PelF n=1 Tax=Luteococcus sp. Sow4_B9 TaxID=3438792 RepID=UPI003F9C8E84
MSTPADVRVGLLGEGTYPTAKGGVSTWADLLIRSLPDHEFHVVSIVGLERTPIWRREPNVKSLTLVGMWDPPARKVRFRGRATNLQLRNCRDSLHAMWRCILPPEGQEADLAGMEEAMQSIVTSSPQPLSWLLRQQGSTEAMLDAWALHARGRNLPTISGGRAALVARHTDRALAVMDTEWPEVDVINATSNGPSSLMALARHWRDGTPIMLTEHGVYLRERYLAVAEEGMPWDVRYAMMAFTRAVCQLAYERSEVLTPVSDFNGRWAVHLGAEPATVRPIANGVEAGRFPVILTEPTVPTISWVGRIDPLKDLGTLVWAFSRVRERVPQARLRLFGPTPAGNEDYEQEVRELVTRLSLQDHVTFEGPRPSALPALEAGHVVALSSISEGMPFTVIEAMMSGRATVNTDVGGVGEVTGCDGTAGILVPPRDAEAMGDALADLLLDHDERRRMARAARRRALEKFNVDTFTAHYRAMYAQTASSRSIPSRALLDDPSPSTPQDPPLRRKVGA